MANISVNVAVMENGRILLTQREDFQTWVLPSGAVEEAESLGHAAVREVKEETGMDVELTRLVAVYSRAGNMEPSYTGLFAARPTGGEIGLQAGETIAVKWFPFAELPSPLHIGQSRRIQDAINGAGGLVVFQEIRSAKLPDHLTKQELYTLRDQSGLPRQEFYLHVFGDVEIKEVVEVNTQ